MDGGDHQFIHIHAAEVNIIPRMADKLRQEYSLRPAVPLTKGVQKVGIAIELGNMLDKRSEPVIAEKVHCRQPFKNSTAYRLDFIGRHKLRPFLRQVDGANFAGPNHRVPRTEIYG